MTKHRDVLRCPRCRTALAGYDGLGTVDGTTLAQWRDALDRHQPSCPNRTTDGREPAEAVADDAAR